MLGPRSKMIRSGNGEQMSNQDRRATKRVTVYRAHITGSHEVWEAEYDALADALHFACRDLREGRRTPLCILENGVLVHDRETITRICMEQSSGLSAAVAERESKGVQGQ